MNSKNKHSGTLENLSWKFAERITAQAVTMVVSIILARLLEPKDYGVVSLVTIFITFANVFVSDGFGSALIQKKDADALDFLSVLYFNIAFSIVLYSILFFLAPYVTLFFGGEYELLTPILRVLSLRLILSAINSVQQAYVAKKMMFRKFFGATLFGTVLSAVVGIYMAYNGFGAWALVAQYLTNTTVDTIFLYFSLGKRPLLMFSYKRLKKLASFGIRVLGTGLLITTYQQIRSIIIGKMYSSSDLAYYNKATQFPDILTTNINSSISSVLFPRLSISQNDNRELKMLLKRSIKLSFYVIAPMLLGLLGISKVFISVLLTEKWNDCIPYLQLLCFNSLFYPIHSSNMQIVKAKGRSDISLKLEVFKKIIEIILLIIACQFGVFWIVFSLTFTSTIFTYVNCIPTKKLINYSFKEQFGDIFPTLLLAGSMCLLVLLIGELQINKYLLLGIQITFGVAYYILLSIVTKNAEFSYLCNLVKEKTKKKG